MQPVRYLYRSSVLLVISLLMTAGPVTAAGMILDHRTSDSGSTSSSKPVDPKELQRVPGVSEAPRPALPKEATRLPRKDKGPAVRPQIPKIIDNNSRATLTPIVASISATLTNNDNGDNGQHWSSMIRNQGAKALTANRYELKVLQVLDAPGQTVPAGSSYFLPPLMASGQHGFSSGWSKHPHVRKLRLEVWDTITKAKVATNTLALPSLADQLSGSSGAVANMISPDMIEAPHLILENGKYLGRGAWQLQIRSNNMPFAAGSYTYTWIYRFTSGNDRFFTQPKAINFTIPAGASRTILETGDFYDPQDGDCAGLKQVDIELFNSTTGDRQPYTIPVRIPDVKVVLNYPSSREVAGKRQVFIKVDNHSSYNLLLEYSLRLTFHKKTENGVQTDSYEKSGPLMMPAGQSGQEKVLVDDLYTVFPNLESDDHHICDQTVIYDGFFAEEAMADLNNVAPGSVYINAYLTIGMTANSKCGQGRPLDFVRDSCL